MNIQVNVEDTSISFQLPDSLYRKGLSDEGRERSRELLVDTLIPVLRLLGTLLYIGAESPQHMAMVAVVLADHNRDAAKAVRSYLERLEREDPEEVFADLWELHQINIGFLPDGLSDIAAQLGDIDFNLDFDAPPPSQD